MSISKTTNILLENVWLTMIHLKIKRPEQQQHHQQTILQLLLTEMKAQIITNNWIKEEEKFNLNNYRNKIYSQQQRVQIFNNRFPAISIGSILILPPLISWTKDFELFAFR